LFAALIVVLVALPMANVRSVLASTPPMISPPLLTQSPKTAVILSSLESVYPMGRYATDITDYLTHSGYQVTMLTNTQVTVDFLLTQLNNYSIIIWRTNTYTWQHMEYWYVGESANSGVEKQYASDFAQGWINANAGIVGVSLGFFSEHFTSNMVSNVKLMILISTDSHSFADFFLNAGANTVIYATGPIDLSDGQIDDLTNRVVASLSVGQNVYDAVYSAVSPYIQNTNPEDPLDSSYPPPFWYHGNGTLTI
jgi:hypothetical protein